MSKFKFLKSKLLKRALIVGGGIFAIAAVPILVTSCSSTTSDTTGGDTTQSTTFPVTNDTNKYKTTDSTDSDSVTTTTMDFKGVHDFSSATSVDDVLTSFGLTADNWTNDANNTNVWTTNSGVITADILESFIALGNDSSSATTFVNYYTSDDSTNYWYTNLVTSDINYDVATGSDWTPTVTVTSTTTDNTTSYDVSLDITGVVDSTNYSYIFDFVGAASDLNFTPDNNSVPVSNANGTYKAVSTDSPTTFDFEGVHDFGDGSTTDDSSTVLTSFGLTAGDWTQESGTTTWTSNSGVITADILKTFIALGNDNSATTFVNYTNDGSTKTKVADLSTDDINYDVATGSDWTVEATVVQTATASGDTTTYSYEVSLTITATIGTTTYDYAFDFVSSNSDLPTEAQS